MTPEADTRTIGQDSEQLIVNNLDHLLPLEMWQLVHTGLVSLKKVPFQILLNRKDSSGRYIRLGLLPESRPAIPFCCHLRKIEKINRLFMTGTDLALDRFRKLDRRLPASRALPYIVTTCPAGLFMVIWPLRIHGCIVAYIVADSLRQVGTEGIVLVRLRTLASRAGIHQGAEPTSEVLSQLSEVPGFSPEGWLRFISDTTASVQKIQGRIEDSFRQRSAENEEKLLSHLTRLLPQPEDVTLELLKGKMNEVSRAICEYCNIQCFAYLRRPRAADKIDVLGAWKWPKDLDLKCFSDCPPLPIQDDRPARPIELESDKEDYKTLVGSPGNFQNMLQVWQAVSRVYVFPHEHLGIPSPKGLVNDLLFFGRVNEADRSLIETDESKKSVFEKITRHLVIRLDNLFRIIQQQHFIAEMSHEMSAPMQGMLAEMESIRSIRDSSWGVEGPQEMDIAFDMLDYYVKHLDNKRRSWLLCYGTEGRPQFRPEPQLLGGVLSEALQVYRSIAKKEGIDFRWSQGSSLGGLPTLSFDKELIYCVLANLLDNAIKYTYGHERHIDFEAKTSDAGMFSLSISNFGFGIKKEWIDQELIFREGWRLPWSDVPSATSPEEDDEMAPRQRYVPGTGIGLSVVRRIMRDHGGEVYVESYKRRGGHAVPVDARFWRGCKTTFRLAFPRPQRKGTGDGRIET